MRSVVIIAIACVWATTVFAAGNSAGARGGATILFVSGSDSSDPVGDGAIGFARQRQWFALDRRPAPPSPSSLPKVLGRAIDAYHAFRYVEALNLLDEAVAVVDAGELVGIENASLADVFIYRGLVRDALGDKDGVWPEFVAAATLSSTRILDPVRFPPTAVETFARALDQVRGQPRGELVVIADEKCSISVDGVAYDGARELPYGSHFFAASCPSWQRSGRVEVSRPRVEIEVAPARRRALKLAEAIDEAKSRGASRLFWVRIDRAEESSALVLSHDISTAKSTKRVVRADTQSVIAALAQLDRVEAPPIAVRTVAESRPWYKSAWLWGAVGAVAAAAIIIPLTYDGDEATTFAVETNGSLP